MDLFVWEDPTAFDPIAYKNSVTEERNRSAQGWHRWSWAINSWPGHATQAMLDQAKITSSNRVIDIAAGDGGQSVGAAKRVGTTGEVLATDIAAEFVKLTNSVASQLGLKQLRQRLWMRKIVRHLTTISMPQFLVLASCIFPTCKRASQK